MRNREIGTQLQILDGLFAKSRQACGDDLEMMSHWARYLCVLAAGLVENAIREIYGDFIVHASSAPVGNYANSQLRQVQNPKTHRILEIAGAFKSEWRSDLEAFVDNGGRREAIDSIMQNRHHIAHGHYSGITVSRVREYLNRAIEVLEHIEDQCAA